MIFRNLISFTDTEFSSDKAKSTITKDGIPYPINLKKVNGL